MVGRDRRSAGRRAREQRWREVAVEQAGVVSRGQLLDLGFSEGAVDAALDSRRWQRLHPGVYATFTGPVPWLTRVWAALLACGPRAAVAGETALRLAGILSPGPTMIEVHVPDERKVVAPVGVTVVRRRRLDERVHPVASPRRVRVEEAVLDLCGTAATDAAVVDVVLRATSSRRTTPERLRAALAARPRHGRRRLLCELLGEAADGVQSALERRFRRDVERPHGLPRACRNEQERTVGRTGLPRSRYRDLRYLRWHLVVELDGLQAHPEWLRHLDRRRDNSVTVDGDHHLEYGWREAVSEPCEIAVEIAKVLWRQGWRGTPTPCGPTCPVGRLLGRDASA